MDEQAQHPLPPHDPGTEFHFGNDKGSRKAVVVTATGTPGEVTGVFLDWRGDAHASEFRWDGAAWQITSNLPHAAADNVEALEAFVAQLRDTSRDG